MEINSSFYRPHRAATYARWADSVPEDFRFCVKVPKAVTHEMRFVGCTALLDEFLAPVRALGGKLGCLLLQLPPKLALDTAAAACFLRELRERHDGAIALEARNASWFGPLADELLSAHRIARVAADPPRAPQDGTPGGSRETAYHRLHGSPRMYFSAYEPRVLDALAAEVLREAAGGSQAWCIFDNTGARAAIPDALYLQRKLTAPSRGHSGPASQGTMMKRKNLRFANGFRVVLGNQRSQAAEMVLKPGKAEGNAHNRHRGADQWLYVLSGAGVATVNKRKYSLKADSLLLIEHGDEHEILNTGRGLLKTLNFYVPPAYDSTGDELPAGKPGDKEK